MGGVRGGGDSEEELLDRSDMSKLLTPEGIETTENYEVIISK